MKKFMQDVINLHLCNDFFTYKLYCFLFGRTDRRSSNDLSNSDCLKVLDSLHGNYSKLQRINNSGCYVPEWM